MKKTYKIDVDCANCANKMEDGRQQDRGREERRGQLHDPENER